MAYECQFLTNSMFSGFYFQDLFDLSNKEGAPEITLSLLTHLAVIRKRSVLNINYQMTPYRRVISKTDWLVESQNKPLGKKITRLHLRVCVDFLSLLFIFNCVPMFVVLGYVIISKMNIIPIRPSCKDLNKIGRSKCIVFR